MTVQSIHGEENTKERVLVFAQLWRRLFARIVDNYLYFAIAAVVVGLLTSLPMFKTQSPSAQAVMGGITAVLALIIWLSLTTFFEAFLISNYGSSLGKFLLNMQVLNKDDSRLDFSQSVSRSLRVLLFGCFLHLPLISILGFASAADRIEKFGQTSWDEKGDTKVHFEKPKLWGMIIVAIILIIPVFLPGLMGPKPPQ